MKDSDKAALIARLEALIEEFTGEVEELIDGISVTLPEDVVEKRRSEPLPERYHYGLRVTYPDVYLKERGIDIESAWSDDPGLTARERAALRAVGRNSSRRKWIEADRPVPETHGMVDLGKPGNPGKGR